MEGSRYTVPITICIAIALHVIWTIGLMFEPMAINATGLHAMLIIAPTPDIAAVIFGAVAVFALGALYTVRRSLKVLLLLPQQAVLWVSAIGALNAMVLGQFADGIQRSNWFLIVDQVPVILIALGHTAALMLLAERGHG